MSNTWIDMTAGKARCIQQATLAVKKVGFTRNFEASGEPIFADQEDCSVLFRCVSDKKLADTVVAGPDSDLADQDVSGVEGGCGVEGGFGNKECLHARWSMGRTAWWPRRSV